MLNKLTVIILLLLIVRCNNQEKDSYKRDEIAENHENFSNSLNIKVSTIDSIYNLEDSIKIKVHFFSNDKIIPDSMYETSYIIDSIFDPEWIWDSIKHPYFICDNNSINILAKDSGKHFISIHCLYNSDAGFNKVKNHYFYVKDKSSNL